MRTQYCLRIRALEWLLLESRKSHSLKIHEKNVEQIFLSCSGCFLDANMVDDLKKNERTVLKKLEHCSVN